MSESLDIYSSPLGLVPLVAVVWVIWRLRSPKMKLPYPPGPPERGLLTGNANDFPVEQAWLAYCDWGKKYGDVIHLRSYGKHTVILNSYEDNVELLERRSIIYSDRPFMPMVDLMGWVSFDAGFMPYGPEWRYHKRLFQKFLKAEVSLKYRPMQTKKIVDFLHSMLTAPNNFMAHYRTLSAAVIMSTMYGYDVAPQNDYFVDLAEGAMSRLAEGVPPDASLFFTFPILRYLPTWFPGTQFKRFAMEAKELAFKMRDIPLNVVREQIKEGTPPNCVATDLLETCQTRDQLEAVAGVVATSFAAGSDTTSSSLGTFIQAMVMFPDVQRKAQKEIDMVVGLDRLITYDDWPLLPYVNALYREVMRWRPVLPLSVFHASSSDDIYKGYFIPKGTTMVSNIWSIAHNPERYPDPDKFNPDRFFDEDGNLNNDDVGYVFGFGRRICPGRHMASATVWLTVATMLQTFDISHKRDSSGKSIPISGKYTDTFIIHPLPFECSITPRSAGTRDLILETAEKAM